MRLLQDTELESGHNYFLLSNMKVCTKCQRTLPFAAFSRCRARKDGYQSKCKDCATAYVQSPAGRAALARYNASAKAKLIAKRYRATEKAKVHRRARVQKWRSTDKGKTWNRSYQNLERVKEAKRQQAKNRRNSPQGEAWYAQYIKSDAFKNTQRRYQQTEKGFLTRQRANSSEKGKTRQRGYRKSLKGRLVMANQEEKRRAARLGRQRDLTPAQLRHILAEWNNRCAWCGEMINLDADTRHPLAMTMDHYFPLIPRAGEPGGGHTIDNIVPAHRRCNSQRRNRDPRKLF